MWILKHSNQEILEQHERTLDVARADCETGEDRGINEIRSWQKRRTLHGQGKSQENIHGKDNDGLWKWNEIDSFKAIHERIQASSDDWAHSSDGHTVHEVQTQTLWFD